MFEADGRRARELRREDIPRVQAFFDANPEYERLINGRDPPPDVAAQDFDERPPPHLGATWHGYLGVFDGDGRLDALIVVDRDLGAPGVWHIGLFIVATRLQRSGFAQRLYAALEAWIAAQGAEWLRLVVVDCNARARRFWAACGYAPVRMRHGVDTGARLNDVHVMLKPLQGGTLDAYLSKVPRDRPGSTLP